jgi:hypothetical protein
MDAVDRIEDIDWAGVRDSLDTQGSAVVEGLIAPAQADGLIASYAAQDLFRSRVIMGRHNFGRGEYQYFRYPLPGLVERLRTALYPPLALIANRWCEAMRVDVRYPDEHAGYLERCHAAGQTEPTPLLLQYEAGDYNCLHQDLYGEQRPRMQSRAEVVPLGRGDAVVFPVRYRPVPGARGVYRVNMRHGVSRIRSGHRMTLGIIFHDAKGHQL